MNRGNPNISCNLDEIEARVSKATEGPWENGDRYAVAGVINKAAGTCAYCANSGAPLWVGTRDINGTKMMAHIHLRSEVWSEGHEILHREGGDIWQIAGNYDWEQGGITNGADCDFIVHARDDIPALIAEVRHLRQYIADAEGVTA